mmetsp:Transcript_26852/g.69038  ORF Transcript_26852/g.69038 Transcript_26852/m.69038 type:complete len:551 (-) Transcript_26852:258-1910(-)
MTVVTYSLSTPPSLLAHLDAEVEGGVCGMFGRKAYTEGERGDDMMYVISGKGGMNRYGVEGGDAGGTCSTLTAISLTVGVRGWRVSLPPHHYFIDGCVVENRGSDAAATTTSTNDGGGEWGRLIATTSLCHSHSSGEGGGEDEDDTESHVTLWMELSVPSDVDGRAQLFYRAIGKASSTIDVYTQVEALPHSSLLAVMRGRSVVVYQAKPVSMRRGELIAVTALTLPSLSLPFLPSLSTSAPFRSTSTLTRVGGGRERGGEGSPHLCEVAFAESEHGLVFLRYYTGSGRGGRGGRGGGSNGGREEEKEGRRETAGESNDESVGRIEVVGVVKTREGEEVLTAAEEEEAMMRREEGESGGIVQARVDESVDGQGGGGTEVEVVGGDGQEGGVQGDAQPATAINEAHAATKYFSQPVYLHSSSGSVASASLTIDGGFHLHSRTSATLSGRRQAGGEEGSRKKERVHAMIGAIYKREGGGGASASVKLPVWEGACLHHFSSDSYPVALMRGSCTTASPLLGGSTIEHPHTLTAVFANGRVEEMEVELKSAERI